MDASQIENYTHTQKEPYHFEKRDYLYIADTSGGNYQQQIQFDTSSWQNSSATDRITCSIPHRWRSAISPVKTSKGTSPCGNAILTAKMWSLRSLLSTKPYGHICLSQRKLPLTTTVSLGSRLSVLA